MKLYFHATCFFVSLLLMSSCNTTTKEENYKKISQNSVKYIDGYMGDNNCVSCHQDEYDLWKGSHHDLAMQVANDSTVLGDFNEVKTQIDGVDYFFFKKGKDFYVKIREIDDSEKEYKIAYAFGVTPLQQYLIDFDKGKKQVLRVTWDTIKNVWFHQYEGDKIETQDWLHWTNGAQNWNTMCAECHSTNLKKNYIVEKDSFHTTYSVINASCESCHGPGEKHVNWANANPDAKEDIGYILKGKTQMDQLNLCAPCHARRVKLTKDLVPGETFADQYMVQNITTNYYHGDGQIDEEDYVYGSFLQSKMYGIGIKCSDCHDAHSLQLKFKGNKLCLQCHVPDNYDSKKHHFHQENTEASQCINCHMTGKLYMGNDFRRDHSFRIPRPDQSVKYDTPNACKACHDKESNQWAADWVEKWYGSERREHFSDALLLSSSQNLSKEDRLMLDKFIVDLKFPEIARATVIENLSYTEPDQYASLLLALKDSSAIVRYNALMKFRNLPLPDRTSIALKHMNDSVKLVRIGVAQLAIGIDERTLSELEKNSLNKSRTELETMLYSNADFSTGRAQLGDYYLQNNDYKTAIKHYEMALKKDSLLYMVYSNLATVYSLVNDYDKALKTLDIWSAKNPELSRPHYLKALLYFEMKNDEQAIAALKTAIKIDPNDTRSMYNMSTYYFQDQKDLKLAEKYVKAALKVEPDNQEYKYLLALVYRDQGKFKSGQMIMKELRANQQKANQ